AVDLHQLGKRVRLTTANYSDAPCPLGRFLPQPSFFFRLLPLVVMPLDGKEHAGAKHGHLEGDEDYRDPIHF
ncbi:hypothetical protein, partial [Escherichia coli]|uniref:hypothetical protein n=1 Tax=Escherichia coli TaxID=562 RepID=UPI001BC8AC51